MAITSIGYDGTIDEVSWVKLQKASASVYGVSTANSWKVTAVAGADRTISIAPGSGWGHHVFDESDTNYTLQGGTVSSGSRWDMVVLRRDWVAVGGGPSAFRLNPGNANRALASRTSNPGVRDDQPIALVQFSAGKTQPTAIVDLRAWGSNGGLEVADRLALDYLATPGAAVKLGTDVFRFELQANGVWTWSDGSSTRIPLVWSPGWEVQGEVAVDTSSGSTRYRMGMKLTRLGNAFSISSNAGFFNMVGAVIPAGHRPAVAVDAVVSVTEGATNYAGIGVIRIKPSGEVAYLPVLPATQTIKTNAHFSVNIEWFK